MKFKKLFQILIEGGEWNYIDPKSGKKITAEKINLKKISNSNVRNAIEKMLIDINTLADKKFNGLIWKLEDIKSGKILSGSGAYLFDAKIPIALLMKRKSTIGDIDLKVPINREEDIKNLLLSIKNKTIKNFKLLGFEKKISQFITIFEITIDGKKQRIQFDFELKKFKSGTPTEFASYSQASSFFDTKRGIKGKYHKLLLRAIAGTQNNLSLNKYILISPKTKKPIKQPSQISLNSFAIDRGYGSNRYKILDKKINGKIAIIKNNEPNYIEDPKHIFEILFNQKFLKKHKRSYSSFLGVLFLIKKYKNKNEIKKISDKFFEITKKESDSEAPLIIFKKILKKG